MGETWHDCIQIVFCLCQQCINQQIKIGADVDDFIAQVKPDIQCDLIIAGSSGVQSLSSFTDSSREPRFNVHVDIFKAD